MKNGICPKCQQTEVYRKDGSRYGSEVVILKDSVFGKGAIPEKYICAACGYVEYYLPLPKDLQTVRDTWEKVRS